MASRSNQTTINIIGTDAAGLPHLAKHLENLVLAADGIAAPSRILQQIPGWWRQQKIDQPLPELMKSDDPADLINWLKQIKGMAVVLASGDPLWFGIGRILLNSFKDNQLHFHPAPCSLQLAFSRLNRPWQDATWISLHGRDPAPLAKKLQKRPSAIAILTDPKRGGIKEVLLILKASGLESAYKVWLCEQLGHKDERIQCLDQINNLPTDIHPLHLAILIRNKVPNIPSNKLPLFGLNDGVFFQHQDCPGLMTKREVRIQLLADLELPEHGAIWDIGAGVGSVGLEALRLRPKLKLLSVDKKSGTASLITENASQLNVNPSMIIEEEALSLIRRNDLPSTLNKPNRVILGGGGSNKIEILRAILKRLEPKGIVVIPLARVEELSELKNTLKDFGCSINISQHQSWRGLPLIDGTRLSPMNPVMLLKGRK